MQTYIAKGEALGAVPENVADAPTMSRLEQALHNFDAYYTRITDTKLGARIARAHDMELYRQYGDEVLRAENMKRRIESALGAWESVKGFIGLGALPLIPLAVAGGLVLAIAALVSTGNRFLRNAEIKLALREDESLTYEEAAQQVDRASQSDFGKAVDVAQLGLTALVLFLAYNFFREQ